MSTPHEHDWGETPLPETRTVDDLRGALSRYGFPGDRERFEEELAAAVGGSPTDDFEVGPVDGVWPPSDHAAVVAGLGARRGS